MIRRTILRTAPLLLAAATLLSACSEMPSDPGARDPSSPLRTVTPTNALFVIDGGSTHACGVDGSGQARCWGRNNYAQLGDNSYVNSSVAVATSQSSLSFAQIAAADSHTCALTTTTGLAYCWGANADGRIGDNTSMNNRPTPVAVSGNIAFSSITAGEAHTCGLSSGQAYCWGANDYGQLGDNTTDFSKVPVAVQQPGGVTFIQITAGKWHTCALALGGQSYCWGYGAAGQLGYGFTFGDSIPAAVSQPVGVTFASINTGYDHTCALTSGGIAYCWGENGNRQLGDNTTTDRYTPVAAQLPSGVTYSEIATAGFSTCAISTTNNAYCWGLGSSGQLGNGSTANSGLPVAVTMPSGVSFFVIRALSTAVCASDGVGQVWCWGKNFYGQLGDNSTTDRSTPVAVVH